MYKSSALFRLMNRHQAATIPLHELIMTQYILMMASGVLFDVKVDLRLQLQLPWLTMYKWRAK